MNALLLLLKISVAPVRAASIAEALVLSWRNGWRRCVQSHSASASDFIPGQYDKELS